MSDQQTKGTEQQKQTEQKKDDGKKGDKKKPDPPKHKPQKAEAVLKEEELQRVIDLGLGRGLDATNCKPWLHKSSFQVRRIDAKSVIGTEEGGSLQAYEREITSVQTQQTDLKASVAIPQSPVTIGVDAEQSRSVSSRRRAVGQRVVNRTISFRDDFEDIGSSGTTNPDKARREASLRHRRPQGGAYSPDVSVADPYSAPTFEERLARWIMQRVAHRKELKAIETNEAGIPIESKPISTNSTAFSGNPVADLSEEVYSGTADDRKQLLKDCRQFVNHFRITHYVSAINLGAAEYRVLTETEYYNRVGVAGSLGVESIGSGAVKETVSWKKTKRASDLKRIGMIVDGKVARGTYDEAVVGVATKPITKLVTMRYLQLALRKAILEYVEDQGDSSDGPFVIAVNNDRLFLTVNIATGEVEATSQAINASLFYIVPTEDGKHPYEFVIAFYGDGQTALKKTVSSLTPVVDQKVDPLPRYLNATVNTFGFNPGPLQLKFTASESKSRLTLHSRLVKKYTPIDTTPWVQGKETFFINCARRKFKVDGYLTVRRNRIGGNRQAYHLGCAPTKSCHNDTDCWMLFRLLPPSVRTSALSVKPPVREKDSLDKEENEELREFERVLSDGKMSPEVRSTDSHDGPAHHDDSDKLRLIDLPPVHGATGMAETPI